MKHKTFFFIILLTISILVISFIPIEATESERPPAPAALRLAIEAAGPGTLDPHFAAGVQDRAVADMIFNGLVRYKPGNASLIEPDLAVNLPESEIVNGKQVWIFKLKKGVLFHPGPKTKAYELTAADVIYSLQKSADPKRSAYAGEYIGMTFEKKDDYTIRIILEKPLSTTLFLPRIANYAGGFIVSKKAMEAMGYEAFKDHPVGTGPFMFKNYTPGKKLGLTANERYFRGRPLIGTVDVLYMTDLSSREIALKADKADCIFGKIDAAWIKKMQQEKNIFIDVFGVGEVVTIHFNATLKPLNDVRVRKAMAYALDRDRFLAFLGQGIGENVYSPVPAQSMPGGLTVKEAEWLGLDYALNLGKARQLLTQAGYPDGFSLEVVTSELDQYHRNYKNMRDQLARVGIDLKIKVVDHAAMHRLIRRDVNPIVVYVAWRPNADVYLTRFFHSDSIVRTGVKPDTNFSHYNRIDNLIEAARLETNLDKQIELWKHAQIKILEDMAAYPLHYLNLVYVRKAYVDFGHELVSSMALYPQITEKTRIVKKMME